MPRSKHVAELAWVSPRKNLSKLRFEVGEGGFAATIHGAARSTLDLDVVYERHFDKPESFLSNFLNFTFSHHSLPETL
jgi:hypothetical protein